MATPRQYPDELREQAVRLALDAQRGSESRPEALIRIGTQLGVNPTTLRRWVRRAETTANTQRTTVADAAQRVAQLEQEVEELRRVNKVLQHASVVFAAEIGRLSR